MSEPAASLPPRLAAVADAVPAGSRVADLGADHGRLALWLAEAGRAVYCLATEKDLARLARVARPRVGTPWAERLAYRAGDGLAAIRPTDAIDTIVLAGLGARTIIGILAAPNASRLAPRRLVLQPRTDAALLRRWLSAHGWRPVFERIVGERGRLHLTIAAERGDDRALYLHPALSRSDLLAAGPLLVRERPVELVNSWKAHKQRLAGIVRKGGSGPAMERVLRDLARAERVLAAILRPDG